MLVICPIFDRCELLPFYLRYYRRLGASKIVIALWKAEQNPVYETIRPYLDRDTVMRLSVDVPVEKYSGPVESTALNVIREEFQHSHPWQCVADLDEFIWYNGMTLPEMAKQAEQCGYNAVHGIFHDRFARHEKFPPINPQHSLDSTFPLEGDVTRCAGININKVPLQRSNLPISSGHHTTEGHALWWKIEVHHFKWSEGVLERLHERATYLTAQNLPWGGESFRTHGFLKNGGFSADPNYCWREARVLGI
jgi:hypothetical protein